MDNKEITPKEELNPKDEVLKKKYIERNFEKLHSRLHTIARTSPKDYVIIALLAVLILLNLFGPSSYLSIKSENNQIKKQVANLTGRMAKVEQALLIPGENSGIEPSKQAVTATPTVSNGDEGFTYPVKEYKVRQGDTLSIIMLRIYNSGDPTSMELFAKYNKLAPPYYDIYPGMILKVPSLRDLKPKYKK